MLPEEHQLRFENTEKLVNEDVMVIEKTEHCDWLVVIMFYGAVHLVEREFASRKKPFHSENHPQRNKEARALKCGSRVQGDLILLHDASLDARYEANFHTCDDLIELKKAYNNIKNILGTSFKKAQ